jgi:hypothetical protein
VAGQPLGQRRPPHYWPRGCPDHPLGRSGVDEPPQSTLGVVRPPPKGQKRKQKKVGGFGVAGPPPRAWGCFRPPHSADLGVARPLGVIRPPPKPLFFFFLVSRPFRGGRTTPKGLGMVSTTPYGRYRPPPRPFFVAFWGWPNYPQSRLGWFVHPRSATGVVRPPPWPIMGWRALPKGVAGHPLNIFRFLYFLFLIIIIFIIFK